MSANFIPTGKYVIVEESGKENGSLSNGTPQEGNYNNGAESVLKVIATLVLLVGVFASLVLAIMAANKLSIYDKKTGYSLLTLAAQLLPSSVVIWAVAKVLCNISNNLHEINSKMKK